MSKTKKSGTIAVWAEKSWYVNFNMPIETFIFCACAEVKSSVCSRISKKSFSRGGGVYSPSFLLYEQTAAMAVEIWLSFEVYS